MHLPNNWYLLILYSLSRFPDLFPMEKQEGSATHSLSNISLAFFMEALPALPPICVYIHGKPLHPLLCIILFENNLLCTWSRICCFDWIHISYGVKLYSIRNPPDSWIVNMYIHVTSRHINHSMDFILCMSSSHKFS